MKNRNNILIKAGVLFVVVIFLVSSATVIGNTPEKATFTSIKKTATLTSLARDEMELKYYNPDNLDIVFGLTGTLPIKWKSAIRLTQDEMAPYADWSLTKVNVAFYADYGQPTIDIRIYIYDKGTTTNPGTLITNDTTAFLDTTGITTVELNTPVPLSGHDELWVAIEWTQTEAGPGVYYAWMDTSTGPHVPDKSDFVYINSTWNQLHVLSPSADGRWGIGAIVEGIPELPPNPPSIQGPTQLLGIGVEYNYTLVTTDPDGDNRPFA